MAKTLNIVPERCTGCMQCELACSWVQTGTFQPSRSVIRVNVFDEEASYDIKTVGSSIRLFVDGVGRTNPDVRLKAAQVEARRLEQAVERERRLLQELKSAREREENQRTAAAKARSHEESLTSRVAEARQEAQRLSELARAEADKITRHPLQGGDQAMA